MELERMQSPYISHCKFNEGECRKRLTDHLNKHGCITRSDFMRLTGMKKEQAISLLNKCIKDESIRKYGSGKTVVYLAYS